jgi:hypothetical protein
MKAVVGHRTGKTWLCVCLFGVSDGRKLRSRLAWWLLVFDQGSNIPLS